MTRPASIRAFSLLEVIIAVALFVASVTVILALLTGLARQAAETADRLAAQRLTGAVKVELERVAATGFDAMAAQVPVMGESPAGGFALVATRNGARVHSRDHQPPGSGLIAEDGQYFLVECWRFPDGPLGYEDGQPVLALCVRVSWPYRGPALPAGARSNEFLFVVSLNR